MAKVTISSVIDAPVEKVWARIRDFNGLPGWHPRMVESHIEDGKRRRRPSAACAISSSPAARRIREKLLDFSDDDHSASATRILETPQPLTNHKATLQLQPRDRRRPHLCRMDRQLRRRRPTEADKIAEGMGANVFQGGFNALKSHFSGQS